MVSYPLVLSTRKVTQLKHLITLLNVLAKAFRTIVMLHKLPDNDDNCPPVMHSRHSKEAHEMLEKYLKDKELEKFVENLSDLDGKGSPPPPTGGWQA